MKKFKVQLVLLSNPQEKQMEVIVEAPNAFAAASKAQRENPGFFGVSAEVIE